MLKKILCTLIINILLLPFIAHAKPTFLIEPFVTLPTSVPANGTAVANYTVTNNGTGKSFRLTMVPITGITQDITAGNCSN